MIRRPATARVLTVLALGWTAAPAIALLVVPGKSIGPVKLGQTQAAVQAKLGKPTTVTGSSYPGIDWHYAKRKLDVRFGHVNPVTGKTTTTEYVEEIVSHNKKDRTGKGIHIGSTIKQFRNAYPKLHCFTAGSGGPCALGQYS